MLLTSSVNAIDGLLFNVFQLGRNGVASVPCSFLHSVHVISLCPVLKDLDWSFWIICQRCCQTAQGKWSCCLCFVNFSPFYLFVPKCFVSKINWNLTSLLLVVVVLCYGWQSEWEFLQWGSNYPPCCRLWEEIIAIDYYWMNYQDLVISSQNRLKETTSFFPLPITYYCRFVTSDSSIPHLWILNHGKTLVWPLKGICWFLELDCLT